MTTPTTSATALVLHTPHQLAIPLKRLRLSGILDTLGVRTQQAIAEQWSYAEFLTRLIQDEVERRSQKQLDLRLRRSGPNTTKTLETFDFTFNASINRQQVFDQGYPHWGPPPVPSSASTGMCCCVAKRASGSRISRRP